MGDERRPQLSHYERTGKDIDYDDDNGKHEAAAQSVRERGGKQAEPVPVRGPKSRSSGGWDDDVHDEDLLDLVHR